MMPPKTPTVSQTVVSPAQPRRSRHTALYIANAVILGVPLVVLLGTLALVFSGGSGTEFVAMLGIAVLSLLSLPAYIILFIDLIVFTKYANRKAKQTPPVYFPVALAVIFWIILGGNAVALLFMFVLG